MLSSELLSKVKNGPLVLILGQSYLTINGNEDSFIAEVFKKYNNGIQVGSPTYDDLLKIGIEKVLNEAAAWTENLSRYIHPSAFIQQLANVPWSAVFTSAIDPVVNRVFENDWRKVQIVFDDRFRISDPRNKMNLHVTKLYGCLSRTLTEQKAPLTSLEKGRRLFVANTLLQRIPETVTNKGLLVIEGYRITDWLDFNSGIYPTVSQLGKEQTIFCSVTDDLAANENYIDLIESKKAIGFKESFAEIIDALQNEGHYQITTPEYEDRFARYITIEGRKLKIPKDIYHKISRSGIVIDDHLFDDDATSDKNERYLQFKEFLSSSNVNNIWKGFPKGFAFKRDYYDKLKSIVTNKLKFNNIKSEPTLLYGQSGGGKTIALCSLAYDFKRDGRLPILFIEKKFQKIDEQQIDAFCRWAEEQGAKGTIIIWDGMVEVEKYYNLIERLNSVGRNVVVVGSAYAIRKPNSNHVLSSAEMDEIEKRRFTKFITGIDVILSNIIPHDDKNILSMFYRYLPVSRFNIQQGLRGEFEHFRDFIREYSADPPSSHQKPPLFDLMRDAGLINYDSVDDTINFDQEEEIDGQKITLADKLIYSVMVPGQFGVDVPFEVLVRNLGYSMVSSTPFRLLGLINIVVWEEDNIGNVSIGSRTPIEAKIITNYLGNIRAQIEYIKSLLASISCDDFLADGSNYESNREIQFAVDLLYNIGTNGPLGIQSPYVKYAYEFAEVLRELRENNYAYHPRLILKEASFLREIVKNNWPKADESNQDLLERAQDIVEQALADLEQGYQEMFITSFLRVELASIIGFRMRQFLNEVDVSQAIDCYYAVRNISSPSFASHPDNYGALDVLAWTTFNLIDSKLLDDDEVAEISASLLNLLQLSETEGVSPQHLDEFNGRKLKLLDLMDEEKLSDELFDRMAAEGLTTGYYIRTNNILQESRDTEINIQELVIKYTRAYNYLHPFTNKIQQDGKCLFLLFRCWWIMQTKTFLLSDEKKTVPLSKDQWEYALALVCQITACDGWDDIAVVLFIKGLAEFHLDLMPDMSNTFKKLDLITDFSTYGSRRIIKSYIASNSDGTPRAFSGEVVFNADINRRKKFGEIWINELKIKIPFSLYEFQQSSYQKGETLRDFYIGFNFRGPIAVYKFN